MPAQIHFHRGREPTEMKEIFFSNEISRLRKVVFGSDALEEFVRKPTFERANAGRVAAKRV
jgi:hypothetical protein